MFLLAWFLFWKDRCIDYERYAHDKTQSAAMLDKSYMSWRISERWCVISCKIHNTRGFQYKRCYFFPTIKYKNEFPVCSYIILHGIKTFNSWSQRVAQNVTLNNRANRQMQVSKCPFWEAGPNYCSVSKHLYFAQGQEEPQSIWKIPLTLVSISYRAWE